jgi:hypothetical protein
MTERLQLDIVRSEIRKMTLKEREELTHQTEEIAQLLTREKPNAPKKNR